ncbi:hypothetical protein [Emticicia aquatilis]|uniref:hypothetical protein n=1 Tax=Emticicia aquatilis TaxID=1537369 RepID=UPI001664CA2F|nr:hypothetical protein [Emticicia aquatilis]
MRNFQAWTLENFAIFWFFVLIVTFDTKLAWFTKAFFSKALRFIVRFLYPWVAYFSGETRNEELAKLAFLQSEQASKGLIIK